MADVAARRFIVGLSADEKGPVNIIGLDATGKVVLGDPAMAGGYTTISLTAAQIIAMNGAPPSLLPAPGAGKVLIVQQILAEMNPGSVAFTGGGTVNFPYHGGANAVPGVLLAAVVTAAPGQTLTLFGPNNGANGLTIPANTGLDITNGTAAFAAGNGTLKLYVWSSIVTL